MNIQFATKPYLPTLVISVVLFILVFLPWASVSGLGVTVTFNGLETNISGLGYLTLIMSIIGAVISFLDTRKFRAFGTIVAGILAIIGIIIFWSNLGNFGLGVGYGLIMALIAALALIVIGYVDYRQGSTPAEPSKPAPPPSDTPPAPPQQ